MDIRNLLETLAAAPKTHRVVTTYKSGAMRSFDAHSQAAAENYAHRERQKIGRELIDRETGKTVTVTSVEVAAIA